MRLVTLALILLLCGCNYGLQFHSPPVMSPQQMLERASLVFIGVIEQHRFDSWPLFRVDPPGESPGNSKYWKILTRVVRVESVLRGEEAQRVVNVYEIFWTAGASGPWNATQNGERAVFLVRKEGGGRYHVVRDWWRSIFPISRQIEAPAKLPLDASSPFWEGGSRSQPAQGRATASGAGMADLQRSGLPPFAHRDQQPPTARTVLPPLAAGLSW